MSSKQQLLAVKELNRNYTHALELLIQKRLRPEKILKVSVAEEFAHQCREYYNAHLKPSCDTFLPEPNQKFVS